MRDYDVKPLLRKASEILSEIILERRDLASDGKKEARWYYHTCQAQNQLILALKELEKPSKSRLSEKLWGKLK